MLTVRYSTKFKKDVKTCTRRKYDLMMLQNVVDILRIPAILPDKNADHKLNGNYAQYKECHIAPDWLLIYKQTDTELLLYRTGTHSDLFNL